MTIPTMKEASSSSAAAPGTSFRLKGYERGMFHTPIRIAHILQVKVTKDELSPTIASLQDLYKEAPRAWKWVTTRHPRMRARLPTTKTDNDREVEATIVPGTLSDEALKATLCTKDEIQSSSSWQDYVWEECHRPRPYNDTTETLFSMTVMSLSSDRAALILFSDHVFSDGFSGYVILRDFLHALTRTAPSDKPTVAAQSDYFRKVPTPLGLQDPMMTQLIPRTAVRRIYDRFIAGTMYWISYMALPYLQSVFNASQVVPNDGSHQKSTRNFATGSPDNLSAVLKRCRSEQTTLVGPICIAIALGMAQAATGGISSETTHIKSSATVDYNLRDRVGMGKDHVGTNIGIGMLASFDRPGLPLDANFWETARSLKAEITRAGDDPFFHALMAFAEYSDPARLEALASKTKDGLAGDVNISNLGRWPYDRQIGPLALEQVHLYHKIPQGSLEPATIFFVTSVTSLQYSMTSKLAHETGVADKVFNMVVTIVENVGSIGPTTTIREVLQLALETKN